jgi:SdpC family antimicrobial peptide
MRRRYRIPPVAAEGSSVRNCSASSLTLKGASIMSNFAHRERLNERDYKAKSSLFSRSVAVILVLSLAVPVAGWGQEAPRSAKTAPYDGQTLYRALFFGTGPLVKKIPTLSTASRYLPADYKALQGPAIKYIQAKDPAFFPNFAGEIQSGDRVKVAAAIRNANVIQKEALVAVTKESNTRIASSIRRMTTEAPREKEPEAENDANVAIEVVVWVAVLVVVLLFWEQPPPAEVKGLSFERYVDEIVRTVPKTSVVARPEVLRPKPAPPRQ